MKKLITLLILASIAYCMFISCEDDTEPQPMEEEVIDWNWSDTFYLHKVFKQMYSSFEYPSEYPSPWVFEDESTWKDIRIDTIIDEESGKKIRVIGAMTVYLEKGCNMPTNLVRLDHMKELIIYAANEAIFQPWYVPVSLETLIVKQIDKNDTGFIRVPNYPKEADFGLRSFKNKLEIHGVEMGQTKWAYDYSSEIDLSGNCLTGAVSKDFFKFKTPVNLSNNNFTSIKIDIRNLKDISSIPNLQNNNIPIPEEWLKTEFWKENHEKFKGNPGYRPPED